MSVLRPEKGLACVIGGVEFHFLFTFAVLDDLQTFYKEPISDIIRKLTDDLTIYGAAGRIIAALIDSDIYNNGGSDIQKPTYQDIMHVLDYNDARRSYPRCFGPTDWICRNRKRMMMIMTNRNRSTLRDC